MRPTLRERLPAFVLLLAVACGGGKKEADKPSAAAPASDPAADEAKRLPAIPSSPAPLPNTVLAVLSVGDPQGQLANLASFADAVQPGFGAALSPAQVLQGVSATVGAPGLEGADLSKPMHFILLDPLKGGGQSLLVVAVADAQKLAGTVGGAAVLQIHAGYAAVGAAPAVQAASPYALSNLAKTAPPAHPHVALYMNRVVESYGPQFEAAIRQSMGQSPTPVEKKVGEGLIQAFSAVERIEADLEASAQVANATFTVFPAKGSTLATWAGQQKPSDYSAASRLPAGTWLLVTAARIDWGPLAGFLSEILQAQGKPELGEWLSVLGQEMAFALLAKEDKTVRVAGLVAVSDVKKVGQLLLAYVKTMTAQATPMDDLQVTAKANAYKTGGATLHATTLQLRAEASAEEKKSFEKVYGKGGIKTYFGAAGDWIVFSLDKDKPAKAVAAKLVQSAKAKQPKSALAASFEKALADSRARSESGVAVFDLSALADDPSKAQGSEVTLGLGFAGPVMRSRITVPPVTIRFLMEQQMRSASGGSP